MKHFLYVFSKDDMERMLLLKYKLIKSDDSKKIYVFENKDEISFNLNDIHAVSSDILTI